LYLLGRVWGNHGIWAALLVLMTMRGLLLTLAWPALRDKSCAVVYGQAK